MTLTLRILRASPSLNDFANPHRTGKWKYRQLRRVWHGAIKDALLEARVAERQPLRWPRPPVLDALKAYDVIVDDSPRAIELIARQDVSPHAQPQRWTEIVLSIDSPMLRDICA